MGLERQDKTIQATEGQFSSLKQDGFLLADCKSFCRLSAGKKSDSNDIVDSAFAIFIYLFVF